MGSNKGVSLPAGPYIVLYCNLKGTNPLALAVTALTYALAGNKTPEITWESFTQACRDAVRLPDGQVMPPHLSDVFGYGLWFAQMYGIVEPVGIKTEATLYGVPKAVPAKDALSFRLTPEAWQGYCLAVDQHGSSIISVKEDAPFSIFGIGTELKA